MKNEIEIIPISPVLQEEGGENLMPATGHEDDAGIDCYALEDITLPAFEDRCKNPGPKNLYAASFPVKLGFGVKYPKRTLLDKLTGKYWHAEATSRSNQNENGIHVYRGILDQGYGGEIVVFLTNMNTREYTYKKGERICQLLFDKCRKVTGKQIRILKKEARKDGGFGSTGK